MMDFVEFIQQKAKNVGWKISKVMSNSLVKMTFEADIGEENVYIRPCGKNSDGNTILEFTSDGIPVPDDVSQAALFSLLLLERNGEMLFGYWGMEKTGDQKAFTVFATMIANTMDDDEFVAAVKSVLAERVRFIQSLKSSEQSQPTRGKNKIDF